LPYDFFKIKTKIKPYGYSRRYVIINVIKHDILTLFIKMQYFLAEISPVMTKERPWDIVYITTYNVLKEFREEFLLSYLSFSFI